MPEDYLSFDEALRDLQMQEAELRAMVSKGKLRAFRDENTLKFRRADVENLRKQRETEPTLVMSPKPKPTTLQVPRRPEPQPVSEEPIDLLADESLDYDDSAETIVGTASAATGDTDLTLEPEAPVRDTKVPTIELTPTEPGTEVAEEVAMPTVDMGAAPGEPGSDTEVPTMVLGLDEYDDTQVATEDVATEEVFLQEGELEEAAPAAAAEGEEPTAAPEEEREVERAVGSITGSSAFGTGEPLAVREEPSPLFTAMCGIASFFLLVPAGIFVYCLISKAVPKWGILESVMRFFCESVFKIRYIS
jgi:hypothetical protein